MSDHEFDPYYQWLGIPPEDQPADYYRLLGLKRFEQNPDVISTAADRQMAHVRSFQTGPMGTRAEPLLNELSAARVCLLNAQKKAAYDAKLSEQPAPRTRKQRLKRAEPLQAEAASQIQVRRADKKNNSWWPVAAVAGVAIVVLVVAIILFQGPDDTNSGSLALGDAPPKTIPTSPEKAELVSEEQRPTDLNVAGRESFNEKIDAPVLPAPDDNDAEPNEGAPAEIINIEPTTDPPSAPAPADIPSTDSPQESSPTLPASEPEDAPPVTFHEPAGDKPAGDEPAGDEAESQRLPVPDAAALRKTLGQLKSVYEAEFEAATTPETRVKLAELLLEQSAKVQGDPTAYYVILHECRDQAVEAGALGIAEDALAQIAEAYDVDGLALRVEMIVDVAKKAQSTDMRRDVTNAALEVVDMALTQERFDEAEQLVKLAGSLAARARDVELRKKVLAVRAEVTRLDKEATVVHRAREALAADADDPKANLTVGLHLCLAKGDWEQGLAHLAKGSDRDLKAAAADDLAAPDDPKQQLALADAWYELATEDDEQLAFYVRAGVWYERAAEKLEGLPRAKAERRVAEISEMDLGAPSSVTVASATRTGIVVRGTATGARLLATITSDGVAATFSPDGRAVAARNQSGALLFDTQTGKQILQLRRSSGQEKVWSLAFSLDGSGIALGYEGSSPIMWDLRTGKEKFEIGAPTEKLHAIAFSPDGRIMATGNNNSIALWDAKSGKPLASLAGGGGITNIAFTPDGNVIAAVNWNGGCTIWEMATQQRLATFRRGAELSSLDFSPDGKLFAVGGVASDRVAPDLAIYEASGRERGKLEGHTKRINCVVFSPDGKTLASAGSDHAVKFWDPETGKLAGTIEAAGGSCDFSPDGKILVTSGRGAIKFWELEFGGRKPPR